MDEYISREFMLKTLEVDKANNAEHCEPLTIQIMDRFIRYIREFPAADVQPVNQWTSVEDRLPDKFDYVLCYCKTTTGEGNEFMFGAYHNDTWWLKTCRTYATLEQPQMRVMYWMPLPKPPKDGDSK